MATEAIITQWDGRQAVCLSAGAYTALVVPSLGANVLALQYTKGETTADILRTPPNAETLLQDPYAYGVPVLFPANRVGGGQYTWDDVTYTFPQNYPNGVHIHGVLHNRPWPLTGYGKQGDAAAFATFTLDTRTDEALRRHFPLDVVIELTMTLDENGLHHHFGVQNHSDKEFPVGLAYHTAFAAPFMQGGKGKDALLQVPLGARCVDDEIDRLPNGKTAPLNAFESRIAGQGSNPFDEVVDALYTAKPGTCKAVITDTATGMAVVYEAGPENHYWILWNQTATEGFIAIEPQTWLSNAMNLPDPKAHDAILVPPGESWQGHTRIYLRTEKE